MLPNSTFKCETREQFDLEISIAMELCFAETAPLRINAHCGPMDRGGNGRGGIMFSQFGPWPQEVIYHVHTTFHIEREVFAISDDLHRRLWSVGKLVSCSGWQEPLLTHVIRIPWGRYANGDNRDEVCEWPYGFIGTDGEAILAAMLHEGSLRKAKR